jgi:hypothetical protein
MKGFDLGMVIYPMLLMFALGLSRRRLREDETRDRISLAYSCMTD